MPKEDCLHAHQQPALLHLKLDLRRSNGWDIWLVLKYLHGEMGDEEVAARIVLWDFPYVVFWTEGQSPLASTNQTSDSARPPLSNIRSMASQNSGSLLSAYSHYTRATISIVESCSLDVIEAGSEGVTKPTKRSSIHITLW